MLWLPPQVNDDDSKKSSEQTGPAAGVASSRPAGAMHHLYDASPPTAKEISEYAQFLGLNPETEEEFLWIAEEALCAPLPAGWSEHYRCVCACRCYTHVVVRTDMEHGLLQAQTSPGLQEIVSAHCTDSSTAQGGVRCCILLQRTYEGEFLE